MNPAPSVILFTTLSGAGYGMVVVAGLMWTWLAAIPQRFAISTMVLAMALIVTGLMSSALHLGRPERAWRALSQWRTSWLSREGILAIAGFVPIAGFAAASAFPGLGIGAASAWGLAGAAASLATLFTTAMIYRSLKPIAQWHHPWVVPGYLVLGPMTGALMIQALAQIHGGGSTPLSLTTLALMAAGGAVKMRYWNAIDTLKPRTVASAIGQTSGTARSVEWPHTEENYLLKEMGFTVARRHATRLRKLAALFGWIAPFIMTIAGLAIGGPTASVLYACGTVFGMIGVMAERWLFFAEARHTVTLYYGR
jgi:DMSO reductase anchor subunit